MADSLPNLNSIWYQRLGVPLNIGIGIHTGFARIGNSGSRTRLKYGPRGATVNLASRLESITKEIGVPMVISGETAKRVRFAFDTTRVFRSTLRGFTSPTDIFRVYRKSEAIHCDPFQLAYDNSLRLFEAGKLTEAQLQLVDMTSERPEDPMFEFLLREVMNQAVGYSNDRNNSNVKIPAR
jgi:adenylate cyclase